MEAKNLIEITKQTVDEVDRILRLDNSSYVKEFGCELDRTPLAKIEKVGNMMSTLNFFIDRYYDQNPQDRPDFVRTDDSDAEPDNKCHKQEKKAKKKHSDVTPLYG